MRFCAITSLLVLAAMLSAGCDPDIFGRSDDPITPPPAQPTGPVTATDRAVMVHVNGQPIYMQPLYDVLVGNFGLPLAQQFVANEVIAQAARAEGITVSPEEVSAETDRALKQLSPESLPDETQREALLDQLLERRGLTRELWQTAMRRNAMLRKMAEQRVEISDQDLREQYDLLFGRKVQVRLIELGSLASAQEVLRGIEDGQSFTDLVAQYSEHPSRANDGLISPISAKSVDVPPAIRQAAVVMQTPNEVSQPIRVSARYYLLQLVKVYESEEADFEAVRDQLYDAARENQITTLRQTILSDLMRNAEIRYVDPILRAKAAEQPAPSP